MIAVAYRSKKELKEKVGFKLRIIHKPLIRLRNGYLMVSGLCVNPKKKWFAVVKLEEGIIQEVMG